MEDGSFTVDTTFPEDRWVYGFLLSFGPRQYPALIFQLFPKGSIANFRRTMRTFHPSLKFRMFKGIFPFNVQVLSSLGFVSRLSNAFFSFLNNWKSLFTAQGPCGKDFSAYTGA